MSCEGQSGVTQSGSVIVVLLMTMSGLLAAQDRNYTGYAYIYYNPQFESYPWVTSSPPLDYSYINQHNPDIYPYYPSHYYPLQPGYSTPTPFPTHPPYPTQPSYPPRPPYPPQPTYPPQPPQPSYPPHPTYPVIVNPNTPTFPPYPSTRPTGPTVWPTGKTPVTIAKTVVWPTGPPTKPPSIQMWPTGETATTRPTTPTTTTPVWPTGRAQTTKPPSHQVWPTGRSGTTRPPAIPIWPTGTPVDEEPKLNQEWPTNPTNTKLTTPSAINWPTGPDKTSVSTTPTKTTTTEKWPTGSPSSKLDVPRWPTRRPGTAPPLPEWPTDVAINTPPTPPPVWPTMGRNEKPLANPVPTASQQLVSRPIWPTQRTGTHLEPSTFSPGYILQDDSPTYIVPLYHIQVTTPQTETTRPPTQHPEIPYTLPIKASTEKPLLNATSGTHFRDRSQFQPSNQESRLKESKRLQKTKPPIALRLPEQLHTHPVTVTPSYYPGQTYTVDIPWFTYIVPLYHPQIPSEIPSHVDHISGSIPLTTTITTMQPTTATTIPTTTTTAASKRCNKLCLDENGHRYCCGNEGGQCPARPTNCSRTRRKKSRKSESPCVLDTQCAENFKCCLDHCDGEYYCTRVSYFIH